MRTAPTDLSASTPLPRAPRAAVDRCPTAIKLHHAADGLIARVRLPGGRLTPEQASLLAEWAAGVAVEAPIELTGRGNLQVRGLRTEQAGPLAAALHGAGLLPSEPHDQARTIVASPLAGRLDGAAPVDDLVQALDDALCDTPALAALSGRFLWAVDDGTGAVDLRRADLGLQRAAPTDLAAAIDDRVTVWVGGTPTGAVGAADAPGALVALALQFLAVAQGEAWQVRELADGGAALRTWAVDAAVVSPLNARAARAALATQRAPGSAVAPLPLGPGRQADGRGYARALAPLGRLTAPQLRAAAGLAAVAGSELRIATDRTLTIPDLPLRYVTPTADGLAAAGLPTSAGHPAVGITACAGRGCASSNGDVRAAAALRIAARGRCSPAPAPSPAPREHLVGCDRRCGAPAGNTTDASVTFILAAGETPEAFAARVAAARRPQETP